LRVRDRTKVGRRGRRTYFKLRGLGQLLEQ